MLSENPLTIEVGDLVRRPGGSKPVDVDAHVPGLEVGLGKVTGGGAVSLSLLLEVLAEGVLVTGSVSGTLEMECSRCLVEFESPFEVEMHEVYTYPDQPVVEEGFVVWDDMVDLIPAIRDAVLPAVPVSPLHDPECKGLCATCGQDLNVADCGHSHSHVDIRWEPLQRLRDTIGE